jgi:hypothetical protein
MAPRARPPIAPELDLSAIEPGTVVWYRRRRYVVATHALIVGGPFAGDLRLRAVPAIGAATMPIRPARVKKLAPPI